MIYVLFIWLLFAVFLFGLKVADNEYLLVQYETDRVLSKQQKAFLIFGTLLRLAVISLMWPIWLLQDLIRKILPK